MFVEELKNFHKIGAEEEQWVTENVEGLDESQKLNFSRELQNYKEITINVLKNVFLAVTGKQSRGYYWAVCLECGCEYDYELPMCPDCYNRELECRAKAVKKSEFQPPAKVIRYNKKYMNGDKGEKICYSCESKKGSYCRHFGQTDWNCRREEFESCECRTCCAIAKKANKVLEENKEIKSGYAIPLKKGVEE